MALSGAERARRFRERREEKTAKLKRDVAEQEKALRIAAKIIQDLELQVENLERRLLGWRT
jgi:hypothetical protein